MKNHVSYPASIGLLRVAVLGHKLRGMRGNIHFIYVGFSRR